MSPKNLLDKIEIVSPCSANWNSMIGNDQVRYCEHCNLNVHDLLRMTQKQLKHLIIRSRGQLCVRYFPDPDGSMPHPSVPQKIHQISPRVSRIVAGAFTASLSFSSAIAQTQQSNRSNSSYAGLAIARSAASTADARDSGGAIIGSISDPNGALITGASISIANRETKLSLATVSNLEGEYKFEALEAGTYLLTIEAPGFLPAETTTIVLAQNARQRFDRSLEVAGVIAEVEIRAEVAEENVVLGGAIIVTPAEPLVKAAQANDLQAVRDVLLATANVNIRDKHTHTTALEQAVGNGNSDMVQVLIWAGADVNASDGSGQTALMMLGEKATSDIVWDLVSAGANVNAKDHDDDTALIEAALRDNASLLRALLDAGAEVDARNNQGQTALMIAASEGLINNVKALVLAGANISVRDNDGQTSLSRAKENDHPEVVRLLQSYGADQ